MTNNPSQNMTLWKLRGVSARYANKAAYVLGCDPSEISRAEAAPASMRQRKLSDSHSMLLAATEGMDHGQLAKVIAFAVQLSSTGRVAGLANVRNKEPEAIQGKNDESDLRGVDAEARTKQKYHRRKEDAETTHE